MLPSYFVILGSFLGSVGTILYAIQVVRGNVKPNRVSFFLWGFAPLVAFVAQVKQGVGIESILTFMSIINSFFIFAVSFINKKSVTPWFLALVGVTLALLTINTWTFANTAFMLYAFILDGVIVVLAYYRIGERLHTRNVERQFNYYFCMCL